MTIEFVETCQLPTQWGEFAMHGFDDASTDKEHIALTMGDLSGSEPVLMRVHSECLTGDALFSARCDCGAQLRFAMQAIAKEGRGILLYLKQEGRGIGLLNKIKAYKLQEAGADTVEANERLGFGADQRDYSVCKPMLDHFGIRTLRVLTNNPTKVSALEAMGYTVVERLPIETGRTPHNEKYMATKAGKMGHLLEE